MYKIKGRYTEALVTNDETEEQCVNQIHSMINHVAFDNKVVLQVDAHAGKGSVVGFTMPLGKYLVPNTIGVDISCGVLSANIGDKISITLKELDDRIRRDIPMGTNIHEKPFKMNCGDFFSFEQHFPWKELNDEIKSFVVAYNTKFGTKYNCNYEYNYKSFCGLVNKIGMKLNRSEMGINSLGSGNHYCELGKSENTGNLWISIHSGSRNFGKMICEYHQNKAKKILDKNRNEVLKARIEEIVCSTPAGLQETIQPQINAAKKELGLNFDFNVNGMEFLKDDDAFEYLIDMVVAQKYAHLNRMMMLDTICLILGGVRPLEVIETVHNYIDFKDFIIRKGAIRSYVGEKMIVALNMKDGSLICEGKSNPEWNYSCGHGAGRKMSRSSAKENLSLDFFKKEMEGIYSTSVCHGTLDECKSAYKDSGTIEKLNEPTAKILDRLKPLLNIKDKNSGPTFKERKEAKKKDLERKAAREAANHVRMKSKYK